MHGGVPWEHAEWWKHAYASLGVDRTMLRFVGGKPGAACTGGCMCAV